jgi:hypothetical protein
VLQLQVKEKMCVLVQGCCRHCCRLEQQQALKGWGRELVLG